ncbi:hypothetical protein EBR43_05105 [bacterium]|nr:hypothetical protein [bacterium]
MRKILNLTFIGLITACGMETEEDRILAEIKSYSNDLIDSCLNTEHKELCSSKTITAKILDKQEEKSWNSICWTEVDLTSSEKEQKFYVAISAAYLNMGNRKLLVQTKIYECLVWFQNVPNLSFSEFASDLKL